jgi:P-type conjugative transfer protein TrbJ
MAVSADPVAAETRRVAAGGDIQAEINRSRPGDTIVVAAGDYRPFEITRNSIRIVSERPGGARIVAASGRAISSYGQNNISIEGFRVSAARSDGVVVTGVAGRLVTGIRISGVIVENAGLDGIKLAQVSNSRIASNRIERSGTLGVAGSAGNRNGDGGIDCVTCERVAFENNSVSGSGWASLMLKTNSRWNTIAGNSFSNTDPRGVAISVGGKSDGRAAAAAGVLGNAGTEASGNVFTNNRLSSRGCAFAFIDAANNRLTGNRISQGRSCPIQEGSNNGSANVTVPGPVNNIDGGDGGGDGSNGAIVGGDSDTAENRFQNYLLQQAAMSSGSDCGSASGTISTAGSVISGILGGGRATLPAQIAQQVQLIFQSVCAAKQLAAQMKMLQKIGINTAADVEAAMVVVQNVIGVSQRVAYELAKADADWRRVFMEVTGIREMPRELTFPAMGERYSEMREFANEALMEAARVRSLAVTNMKAGNDRIRSVAEASADAVGPTQAVQAGNLLMLETRQELQGMHQTVLSYNEAQSRIDQEKRVQNVLAGIFMAKNMESMNPEPTPPQGVVVFDTDGQQSVTANTADSLNN